jgi:hypothetical protein
VQVGCYDEVLNELQGFELPAFLVPLAVLALLVMLALALLWVAGVLLARRPRRKHQYITRPTRFDLEERHDVAALIERLEQTETADGAMKSLVRMTRDGNRRLTSRIVKALMTRCVEADPTVIDDREDFGASMARRTLVRCGDPALRIAEVYVRRQNPKYVRAAALVLAQLRAYGEATVSSHVIEMVEFRTGETWRYWEALATGIDT